METLIIISVNSSSKAFPWPNMKKFSCSVLTANSRFLQSAALNLFTRSGCSKMLRTEESEEISSVLNGLCFFGLLNKSDDGRGTSFVRRTVH